MSETEKNDTADIDAAPKGKRGKAADVATVKLNLNLSGIGARDDLVELPTAEAEALVAMGHADPVVEGEPVEVPRVTKPSEDGEPTPPSDPVEPSPDGINVQEKAEPKKAPAKAAPAKATAR